MARESAFWGLGTLLLTVAAVPFSIAHATTTATSSATAAPEIVFEISTSTATTADQDGSENLELRVSAENEEFIIQDSETEIFVPGQVVVKYKDDVVEPRDTEVIEVLEDTQIALLEIGEKESVEDKVRELERDSRILYAEPNYRRQPFALSSAYSDTRADEQWSLHNIGQTVRGRVGTVDADIDAPEAWLLIDALASGTDPVIVAVIDTGVAYNHPDLSGMLWDGSSCLDSNGDPLGGCTHGYDFDIGSAGGDGDPLPSALPHGTHVAGVIAAMRDNALGTIGVSQNVEIMAVKFGFDTISTVAAINFARENGARIINASFGGGGFSQAEHDAIEAFRDAGGIFVAAAGNTGSDNDSFPTYPASYDLDNIITVAATDELDELTTFSSYGATSVDVGAPGQNVLSTYAENFRKIELFEIAPPPSVSSFFDATSTGSNWGTYDFGFGYGNVLVGDLAVGDYAPDVDHTITSIAFDLSAYNEASLTFTTACETEYTAPNKGDSDYMVLEYSSDGTTFSEVMRWNEQTLTGDAGDLGDGVLAFEYFYDTLLGSGSDLTSDSRIQFRWVTDGDSNDHFGCFVDRLELGAVTDGAEETYEFLSGTSMAAPHVSGLAALLWGVDGGLQASEVINTILDTGDALTDLDGVTATGKRINAYGALASLLGTSTPSVPQNLIVSSSTDETATLHWNEVSDALFSHYNIYRNNVLIASTTATGTIDTGISASSTYSYEVTSVDVFGNESARSNAVVIGTGTPADTEQPTVPSGLTAANVGETSFTLSWLASTDNVALLHYEIYQNGVLVATTSVANQDISGLTAATTYTYSVVALDTSENRATSSDLSVTTAASSQSSGGGSSGGGGGSGSSSRSGGGSSSDDESENEEAAPAVLGATDVDESNDSPRVVLQKTLISALQQLVAAMLQLLALRAQG